MISEITTEELYKLTAIALAKNHLENCQREKCNISLYLLLQMAEKAGAKFTEAERRLFY